MFSKRLFKIFFVILINALFKIDCIVIKWITENTFNNDNYLRLEQNIPTGLDESFCKWYKLNANLELDATTDAYYYIYMHTKKQCNLIIISYDNKTHSQLDYYKPVLKNTNIKTETYVLGYYQTFNFKLLPYNSTISKLICELKVSFPDSNDQKLVDLLKKESPKFFSIQNSKNTPKSIQIMKRNEKLIFDFIISESNLIDHKSLKNKTEMKCDLNLFDLVSNKQTLVLNKTLRIPLETTVNFNVKLGQK